MPIEHSKTRVLVVDDEESQRGALAGMIALWGYDVETACDGVDALEKLNTFNAHVIVTDMMMPRMDGSDLIKRLRAQGGGPPVIVETAFGNPETAIGLVHDLGVFWFLEKPVQSQWLKLLLERAAAHGRLEEHAELLERELSYQGVLGDLVGSSPQMQEVYGLIRQVAPSRAAVLITGESGTGKELVARAIHELSPRRAGPFVALNCAAMPDTLMESELFGHEKGAFTGAVERRAGSFEMAQNGTVLLDEIGDMPMGTQAKLLRVLEDQRVRRLGGKNEIQLDVRVIAATNAPLDNSIKDGKFREDLFYRLNVFPIPLPPLREHLEDLPQIASSLLEDLNKKHNSKVTDLSPEAVARLSTYHWPGNVRELRNMLERAVILTGEGTVEVSRLPHGFGAPGAAHSAPVLDEQVLAAGAESGALRIPVGYTIEQAERALIGMTLEHTKNNKTRAAEILGISQKTLFNKLKEYGAQGAV
jgi:DNA-binding NtrC family response regulator